MTMVEQCDECKVLGGKHKASCNAGSVWNGLSDDDPIEVAADWQNHHIEGFARAAQERGIPGRFKAPLFSHVTGNLWSGGVLSGVRLPDDFVRVFSLYPWEKYRLGRNTERVEVTMYDSADIPDPEELDKIVDQVLASLEEGKTLVHCQAGLNRSGLISALTLIEQGMTGKEAIALLREKRSPLVLCNETFENFVLAVG